MRIYLTHYRTASTSYTELLEDIAYPQKVHIFPETMKKLETGIFSVAHRVLDKVLDPELMKQLKDNYVGKTAVIFSVGTTSFAGTKYDTGIKNRLNYNYKFRPFSLTQIYAGRIAQQLGQVDQITTDSSACASSLKVLMDVQTLIKHYNFDRVIVMAIEDGLSNTVLDFFGDTKASLLDKEEKETGLKPSAFDAKNGGFYVGQGAVFAVFESERAKVRLRSTAYASLRGAYSASESSTNAIGQLESGEGFIKAIQGAMYYANVTAKEIKIVKTHGTGTVSNNKAEAEALKILPDFIATSYKQKIGHTLGASGLLETCLLLDDMRNGFVPKIENRTKDDDVYLSYDAKPPKGLILSLAAGMGNIYSAAILEAI